MDLRDPNDKAFADLGENIAKLIDSPKVRSSGYSVAELDDFLGAAYALVLAKHNNPPVKGRAGPIEVSAVLTRAKQLGSGRLRMAGAWLAGFHLNSALFRLAGVYERGLKVVTGNETKRNLHRNDLLPSAESAYRTWKLTAWQHTHLDKVYDEVNHLKHETKGIFFQRTVALDDAKSAGQELIELLEAWNSQP
jgi:hypothetical protein